MPGGPRDLPTPILPSDRHGQRSDGGLPRKLHAEALGRARDPPIDQATPGNQAPGRASTHFGDHEGPEVSGPDVCGSPEAGAHRPHSDTSVTSHSDSMSGLARSRFTHGAVHLLSRLTPCGFPADARPLHERRWGAPVARPAPIRPPIVRGPSHPEVRGAAPCGVLPGAGPASFACNRRAGCRCGALAVALSAGGRTSPCVLPGNRRVSARGGGSGSAAPTPECSPCPCRGRAQYVR